MSPRFHRRYVLPAALLALLLTSSGCATSRTGPEQADRFFTAGSFPLAIAAYERYLNEEQPSGEDRAYTLYRLAVAKTLSAPSVLEPDDSTPDEDLTVLIKEHPESAYRHEAQALLELLNTLARMRQDINERTARLEQWIGDASRLREDLTRLKGEKEGAIDSLDRELLALERAMQKRDDEIAAQKQQISRLIRELEKLKEIDTGG